MTSPKPTRQQIVDAYLAEIRSISVTPSHSKGPRSGEGAIGVLADILVKAGYAEEPREEGWYWVKFITDDQWCAIYHNGEEWFLPDEWHKEPAIIGPRITPPEER